MTINSTKTKYKIAARDRARSSCVNAEVMIEDDEKLVHLGMLVTSDNDVSREIKRRIEAANKASYG